MQNANLFLLLSIVLIAGVGFGAVAKRFRLPSVTGQILAGILIGPTFLHWVGHQAIDHLHPLIDFALTLMAVSIGSHLGYRRLRNAKKRLGLLLLFEAVLTPLVVFALVNPLGAVSPYMAALLAAIAISTAPATILALVKETHARGVFVKTLVAGVALNNLACIFLFEVALSAARSHASAEASLGVLGLFLPALKQMVLSGALGAGIGLLLILATRKVMRPDRLTALSMMAILLTTGVGQQFEISTLLAGLVLGMTLSNVTPDKDEIGHRAFENFEYAIFAIFFTLAGAELDFGYLPAAGAIAAVMFLARGIGKLAAAGIALRLAGATAKLRRYLGLALLPQAGLAVGLMLTVTRDPLFRDISELFLAVVLTVVLMNELLGPILTRLAIMRSGDAGMDRPSELDFIREQHIVTDLDVATKREAVERLVDLAVRSNHLSVDVDDVVSRVMQREEEESTCLGHGLSVPHARLESDVTMIGAIGVSRAGLKFEHTPDGEPVHCILLLLTGPRGSDRHLEALSAFARIVGHNHSLQQQLFHARSPAHVYELLHAEDVPADIDEILDDSGDDASSGLASVA